jgi:hypothetical protein
VAEFKETLGADTVRFPVVVRKHPMERPTGLVRYVGRLRGTA